MVVDDEKSIIEELEMMMEVETEEFRVPRIGSKVEVDFKNILKDNKELLDKQRMYMFGKRFLCPQFYDIDKLVEKGIKLQARCRNEEERISSGNYFMSKISHISSYIGYLTRYDRDPESLWAKTMVKHYNQGMGEYSIEKYYKHGIEMAIGRRIGETPVKEEVVDFLRYAKECIRYYVKNSGYISIEEELYDGFTVDMLFYIACYLPSNLQGNGRLVIDDCWELKGMNPCNVVTAKEEGLLTSENISLIRETIDSKPLALELEGWKYVLKSLGKYVDYNCLVSRACSRYGLDRGYLENSGIRTFLDKKAFDYDDEDKRAAYVYRYLLGELVLFNKKAREFKKYIEDKFLCDGARMIGEGQGLLYLVLGYEDDDWFNILTDSEGEYIKELYHTAKTRV